MSAEGELRRAADKALSLASGDGRQAEIVLIAEDA